MDGRVGDWQQTFTGGRFYVLDPRPEEVRIEDIAHSLAGTNRYNAHGERFYSVAEHSALLAFAMTRDGQGAERALQGLLHDAAEAYTGDLTRSLKLALGPLFAKIERDIERAIQEALGLRWAGHCPASVEHLGSKAYDDAILYDECKALFTNPNAHWHEQHAPGLGVTIRGMTPRSAETLWLNVYGDLTAAVARRRAAMKCPHGHADCCGHHDLEDIPLHPNCGEGIAQGVAS
jgi:hypothetical protein